MSDYQAPLKDMRFVLTELADLAEIAKLPGCEEAEPDVVEAILEEASKFAAGVLSPLNIVGDKEKLGLDNGVVTTVTGWKEAYQQFAESGWNGLSCNPEFGGQGLPRLVSTLVDEMWSSANVAFQLCPLLTQGAIEALELAGSEDQKNTYLPKLVSGEWTGTMNLTEPQAGSDLSAVRTRAVPQGDGTYRLFGQKIFITYGEHDMTENIVHLVLARTPDAPEGVKGISLFVAPKYLVNADGSLGERNDVQCVSLEHKLGIHASPTAVLAFGDHGGAVAQLVGEENRGLEYMFVMMNAARFSVGLQGIGLSERAYQRARTFAGERVQGTEAGIKGGGKVAILRHPDVRRMLLLMKSQTEAMRAIACVVAAAIDRAHCSTDAEERARNQAFVDLMIPVVKGCSTENSIDIASLGVQVHGGMGFIEETGAAQHLRDARITSIYEGTTGIQATDLVGRKIARDSGATISALLTEVEQVAAQLSAAADPQLNAIGTSLQEATSAARQGVAYIVANYKTDIASVLAGAVPFLKLFGVVCGGWQMGRAALIAAQRLQEGASDTSFLRGKLLTAHFYADHVLAQAGGFARAVTQGATSTLAITDEQI